MTDLEKVESSLHTLVKDAKLAWRTREIGACQYTFDTFNENDQYCLCLVSAAFAGANPEQPLENVPRGQEAVEWAAAFYGVSTDAIDGLIVGFDQDSEFQDGPEDFEAGYKIGTRVARTIFGEPAAAPVALAA